MTKIRNTSQDVDREIYDDNFDRIFGKKEEPEVPEVDDNMKGDIIATIIVIGSLIVALIISETL